MRNKKIGLLILISIIILFSPIISITVSNSMLNTQGSSSNAEAGIKYNIFRLTDDPYEYFHLCIHNGKLAWAGYEDIWHYTDEEVFFYDPTDDPPITKTTNNYWEYLPDIYNGKVVWEAYVMQGIHIFLKDLETEVITQITELPEWDGYYHRPKIHKNLVTWYGHKRLSGGGLTSNEIFLYNLAEPGLITQITDNGDDDNNPEIHDGIIAWTRSNDIWYYDANDGSITQIVTENIIDEYPKIHNGQIVWSGREYVNGWHSELYFYDCASGTGTPTIITEDFDYGVYQPQIHDGKIVWQSYDGNDYEIFLYDSNTGTTTQIKDNDYDERVPLIHNKEIAWLGFFKWKSMENL